MCLKVLLLIYSILESSLKSNPPRVVNPCSINKNSRNSPYKTKKAQKKKIKKREENREDQMVSHRESKCLLGVLGNL